MKRRSFLASLAALLGLRPKIAEPSRAYRWSFLATDFPDGPKLASHPSPETAEPRPGEVYIDCVMHYQATRPFGTFHGE